MNLPITKLRLMKKEISEMDTHIEFASTSADKNLPYTLLKKNISNFDYSESTYLIKNDSKVVTFRMYISITHLHRYVCSKGDNFLKKGEFPKLSSQKVHINYNPY